MLTEQKNSGQSVAAFCRERGLGEWQFYEWKKRLRPATTEPFLAIELVAATSAGRNGTDNAGQSAPLEFRLRCDRSVLVGPDFEASHFRRLLQILEQEP